MKPIAADVSLSSPGAPPDRFEFPGIIKAFLLLNIVLQIFNLFTTAAGPNLADGQGYMAWGKELVTRHQWDASEQFRGDHWFSYIDINGKHAVLDPYPIGWSLLTLPTMAIGHWLAILTNHFQLTRYKLDGTCPLLNRGAWIGVYLWVDIGLICAFKAIQRLVSTPAAKWAVPMIWLGTSAYAYTWRWPYMSHGLSLACLSILAYLALRLSRQPRAAAPISLFFGFLSALFLCVRTLNITYLVPILFLALCAGDCTWRDRARSALLCAIGGIVPLFLQAWCWKSVYGAWYFNGYGLRGEGFAVDWGHLVNLLFSSFHGLFFMHPITLLSFGGLIVTLFASGTPGTFRAFALLVLAALAANILLYAFWHDYHLGDSFGARWACDCYLYWALGFALFLRYVRFARPALWLSGLLALSSFVILTGQVANRVTRMGPLHVYIPTRGWRELP